MKPASHLGSVDVQQPTSYGPDSHLMERPEVRYQRSTPSARARKLKEQLVASRYEMDIERARYYTRSWKRTEGVPPCMRAALALQETLRHMTIRIDDDETLVGVKSFKRLAGPIGIERWTIPSVLLDLLRGSGLTSLKDLSGVSVVFASHDASITDDDRREMEEEILSYWEGKNLRSMRLDLQKGEGLYPDMPQGAATSGGASLDPKKLAALTPGTLTVLKALKSFGQEYADGRPGTIDLQGHVTVGIKRVLDLGFSGIAEQAARNLAKLEPNAPDYEQRKDFLESVQVAAEAVCEHADRYARLAAEKAAKAAGERRKELLEIAERCRRVPANPPRTFVEAIQSIWMTQVAVVICCGEDGITCPGRVDQFLFPYYQKDLAAGLITRESALDAIEEYYVKLGYMIAFGPNNLTIGGLDRDGQDATNEVSHLLLEAHTGLRGVRNGLAVRISPKTPHDFLVKACETHRHTAGVAFYNDEVVIRDLCKDGYSLQDARNYSVVGCTELTGTGDNNGYTASTDARLSLALELALNGGCRLLGSGQRVGVATPPPSQLHTFEDVKKAFVEQMQFLVDIGVRRAEAKDRAFAEAFPTPLLSSTIEGCLESGHDITRGGARYTHSSVNAQGLATVANSLAAVRWAVFEQKMLGLEELVGHLRDNFQQAENLRQQLCRKAPKYGNDDPAADEIAAWVSDTFCEEVRKHKHAQGGTYRASIISAGSQDKEGMARAATPDGRLAGTPVSNGMSAANGTERNGATAALRSAAAIATSTASDGTAFNMNLHPGMIRTDEGVEKLASLVEGYFRLGGRHVQFNPMGVDTLKDAQAHPEEYPDLMVKVSGYSFLFVDLSKSLQDDIIARTEFRE